MSDKSSGDGRTCAECGYNNPATFRFCTNCGAALPAAQPAEPPLRPTVPFEAVQGPVAAETRQATAHAPTVPLSAVTDDAVRAREELGAAASATAPTASPAGRRDAGAEEPAYPPAADAAWSAPPTSLPEPFGTARRTSRAAPMLDAWDVEDVGRPGPEEAPGLAQPGMAAAGYAAADEVDTYAKRSVRYRQPLQNAQTLDTDKRTQTACLIVGFIAAAVLACVIGMAAGVLLVSLWVTL